MSEFKTVNPILTEMEIKEANRGNVYINDEINEESMFKATYWVNKIVSNYDKDIPIKKRKINIYINSYGGAVYDCLGFIGILKNLKKQGYTINTYCSGKAMSAGFTIFIVGVNRYLYEYATLMYHSVSSGAYGKVQSQIEDVEETKRLNDLLMDITLENTKITREKLEEVTKCKQDWFITPKEALELGIATKIL